MLITFPDNPALKVGQLFYKEYRFEDGNFQLASLNFIDEEPKEGKQWMYTQIALIEDRGSGIKAYIGFETGGMPRKYTRIARDEDILKFIKLINEGVIMEDSLNLKDWLDEVNKDNILLDEEKDRIKKLISS